MSWFEDVTGTTNAERQAWRDSFNGGLAVGAGADFYNAGKSSGGALGGSKSGSDGQVKGSGNAGPTPTVTTVKGTQPTNTGGGRGGGPVLQKDTGGWSPTQYAPNQAGGPVTTGNPGPGQQAGTGPGTGGGWFTPTADAFWPTVKDKNGPTKKKDDDGLSEDDNYRYTGIGFGLTWASNRLTVMGQGIEDEMGELGGMPFQVAKLAEEVMINSWRLGTYLGTEQLGPAAFHTENAIHDAWNSMGAIEGANPRINHSTGDLVFTGGGF